MKAAQKAVLLLLLLALGYWVFDAFVDCFFFYEGTFLGMLISDVRPHDLFMRSC